MPEDVLPDDCRVWNAVRCLRALDNVMAIIHTESGSPRTRTKRDDLVSDRIFNLFVMLRDVVCAKHGYPLWNQMMMDIQQKRLLRNELSFLVYEDWFIDHMQCSQMQLAADTDTDTVD